MHFAVAEGPEARPSEGLLSHLSRTFNTAVRPCGAGNSRSISLNRGDKLRAARQSIGTFAGLDLGDDAGALGLRELLYCRALRLKAEAAPSLALGGHPVVGDGSAAHG